ncbi:hypothetical protein ACLB2K_035902 [Fragaria x ananassa]
MATRGSRSEKVKRIFYQFDVNHDGGLNREEMAALVVAVNPRVKFSDEQINAILDEGLLRTYDDGAGNVDRDFDALGLDEVKGASMASEASSSSIVDERVGESQKKQRTAAWAVSPNHGIAFDDTWKIVDDLEILVKRLKAKQAGSNGKISKQCKVTAARKTDKGLQRKENRVTILELPRGAGDRERATRSGRGRPGEGDWVKPRRLWSTVRARGGGGVGGG